MSFISARHLLKRQYSKVACLAVSLLLVSIPVLSSADNLRSVYDLSQDLENVNPEHSMILSFALQDERTQKIWAVGEFGSILSTEDLGETWESTDGVPTDQTLTTIRFKTPMIGFAAGYDTQILKTNDGGKSWKLVHQAPEWEQPIFKIYPLDKYVIAIGGYGLFLISHDEGDTWVKVPLPFDNAHLYDIVSSGVNEFLLVGEMGAIRKVTISAGGDVSFSEVKSADKKSLFGIYPERDGHFIIIGLQGTLLSYDIGTSLFQPQRLISVSSLFGYDQIDGKKILVGSSGYLFMGCVDDDSFTAHQLPSRQNLSDVFLLSPDLALVCGDGGIEKIHLSSLPLVSEGQE